MLAARLARAVYHMLRKEEAFDEDRFWNGKVKPPAAPGSSTKPAAANGQAKPAPASTKPTKPAAARGARRRADAPAR
jgi:hypothetical protein